MQILKISILLLSITMMLNGCRHKCQDPTNMDCDNYDPCWSQKQVKADIEMSAFISQGVPPGLEEKVQDSVFVQGAAINFKSLNIYNEYFWWLGSQTFTTREDYRTFGNAPYGKYTVKLAVKGAPNKTCFPDDDGMDTVQRNFYIVKPCELLTSGTFRGVFDEKPNDIVDISVHNWDLFSHDSCCKSQLVLTNFNNSNDTLTTIFDYFQTNNKILFATSAVVSIDHPNTGYLMVEYPSLKVKMDYYINKRHLIFNGTKIK